MSDYGHRGSPVDWAYSSVITSGKGNFLPLERLVLLTVAAHADHATHTPAGYEHVTVRELGKLTALDQRPDQQQELIRIVAQLRYVGLLRIWNGDKELGRLVDRSEIDVNTRVRVDEDAFKDLD